MENANQFDMQIISKENAKTNIDITPKIINHPQIISLNNIFNNNIISINIIDLVTVCISDNIITRQINSNRDFRPSIDIEKLKDWTESYDNGGGFYFKETKYSDGKIYNGLPNKYGNRSIVMTIRCNLIRKLKDKLGIDDKALMQDQRNDNFFAEPPETIISLNTLLKALYEEIIPLFVLYKNLFTTPTSETLPINPTITFNKFEFGFDIYGDPLENLEKIKDVFKSYVIPDDNEDINKISGKLAIGASFVIYKKSHKILRLEIRTEKKAFKNITTTNIAGNKITGKTSLPAEHDSFILTMYQIIGYFDELFQSLLHIIAQKRPKKMSYDDFLIRIPREKSNQIQKCDKIYKELAETYHIRKTQIYPAIARDLLDTGILMQSKYLQKYYLLRPEVIKSMKRYYRLKKK